MAATSDFDYRIRHADGVAFVAVQGFLDAHTYTSIRDVFDKLFEQQHARLVVDLHEVTYISSAGAGVFIGALERARELDGEIVLMNPSESVLEVFEMLGLTQILRFANTPQEALAHFGTAGA